MAEENETKDGGSILDSNTATQLFTEIAQGYREWELEGKTYRTRFPKASEDGSARVVYAKQFNRNLEEGLLTERQMEKLLTTRGIWTQEDELEVTKLREKVGSIESILAKKDAKDKSKATRKLVEELASVRVALYEKTSAHQEYLNQTVEQIAEEQRTAYFISRCTENADGTPVWDSMDAFLNEINNELVGTATYQYVTFTNGLADNYIEELTEVKFMRAGIEEDKAEAAK